MLSQQLNGHMKVAIQAMSAITNVLCVVDSVHTRNNAQSIYQIFLQTK